MFQELLEALDCALVAGLESIHGARDHHRAEQARASAKREPGSLPRRLEAQCHLNLKFSRLEERRAREQRRELHFRAGLVTPTSAIDVRRHHEASRSEHCDIGPIRWPEV